MTTVEEQPQIAKADSDQPAATLVAAPRAVTWRSVLIGLVGGSLICGLTPYNDYALNNVPMVGNNLPVGAMLLAFLFVVFVNAPLSRWRPVWSFSSGELAVIFAMTLTACAIPSAGLLRYLPHLMVRPFWHAVDDPEYASVLQRADLPSWLFPSYAGDDQTAWGRQSIATGFVTRWVEDGPPPIAAWITPMLAWAAFVFAMFGALLCLLAIVRRQWVEVERLSFPLSEVQMALVEAPKPGRAFNTVLSNKLFWLAFGVIFAIHLWNGTANYWPEYVPRIPLGYNLGDVTASEPWKYMRWDARSCAIYFVVVGASFFVPLHISFSWWAFFIGEQIYAMVFCTVTNDDPFRGTNDQHYGALIAFAASLFWLGRRQWALVTKQAFRGRREGEPTDLYLPYPVAFWGAVACSLIMIGWMMAAGCTFVAAAVAVLTLLTLFLIITRLVAEAGLIHGMLVAPLGRAWEFAAMLGLGKLVPLKSFLVTGMVNATFYDFREVPSVYASHGMRVAERVNAIDSRAERSTGWKFMAALMLALVVGYFVGFYATLRVEYGYASSQDIAALTPINPWGSELNPRWNMVDPAVRYGSDRQQYFAHNPIAHAVGGGVATAAMFWARANFNWWPLHPVGYLMLGTFPGRLLWFSVFLGWFAKRTILYLGGSKLFEQAKPFFLGVVIGESVAAGFWMLVGIGMSVLGLPYRPVLILPI